jgi:hypothetical protein
MTEETSSNQAWSEVGQQFKALGESLAQAFRTAWESEENRQHLQSMQRGLESMVNDIGQVIEEASASPEAQKARQEAEKAVASARSAGEKALEDARPQFLSAMRQVDSELQNLIARLEAQQTDEAAE